MPSNRHACIIGRRIRAGVRESGPGRTAGMDPCGGWGPGPGGGDTEDSVLWMAPRPGGGLWTLLVFLTNLVVASAERQSAWHWRAARNWWRHATTQHQVNSGPASATLAHYSPGAGWVPLARGIPVQYRLINDNDTWWQIPPLPQLDVSLWSRAWSVYNLARFFSTTSWTWPLNTEYSLHFRDVTRAANDRN